MGWIAGAPACIAFHLLVILGLIFLQERGRIFSGPWVRGSGYRAVSINL